MEFARGTPALWQEDMAESRANLTIEGMAPAPDYDAFFTMMLDHPDADRSLPITYH